MNKPSWRTPLAILMAGSIVLTLAMGVPIPATASCADDCWPRLEP